MLPFQFEVLYVGEGGKQPRPCIKTADAVIVAENVKVVEGGPGEDGRELPKGALEVELPGREIIAEFEPERYGWPDIGPSHVPHQLAIKVLAVLDFCECNHTKEGEAAAILGKQGEESIPDVYGGVGNVANNVDIGVMVQAHVRKES